MKYTYILKYWSFGRSSKPSIKSKSQHQTSCDKNDAYSHVSIVPANFARERFSIFFSEDSNQFYAKVINILSFYSRGKSQLCREE